MLLHYISLEHLVPLWHVHITAWCDNTPTVSWTNKLSVSRSPIAGHLTHALAMRIHVNEASLLTSLSIAGVNNTMADTASCTFHRNTATDHTFVISDTEILLTFNSSFPLQNCSWQGFHLNNKIASCVFSELKGKASMLASWWCLTWKGSAVDTIGNNSSNLSVTWTPCSQMSPLMTALSSSPPLLKQYVRTGTCGQGNRMCAGTIQVTVCAIGKTFKLDGHPNPLYRTKGHY